MVDSTSKKIWDSDPELENPAVYQDPVDKTTAEAMQLVENSLEKIEKRGWVLWRLWSVKDSRGNPREICLLRDYSVKGYPPGYPLFSLEELEKLPENISLKTMNLLVHIKVKSDARLDSVEDIKTKETR